MADEELGGGVGLDRRPSVVDLSVTEKETTFRELGRVIEEISTAGDRMTRLFDQYRRVRERLLANGTKIEHNFDTPVMAILQAYESMRVAERVDTTSDEHP